MQKQVTDSMDAGTIPPVGAREVGKFQKLIVWQRAHALCLWLYRVTAKFPAHEQYGLTSQLRRNAQSVPSNIVEGSKRPTVNDRKHYHVIAEGSLEEMKYQLLLARDLGYITVAEYTAGIAQCREVGYLLHALTRRIVAEK